MKLPTLDKMIGLDKFNLTESQKHDCRSLANHRGFDAALEQAKKFSSNVLVSGSASEVYPQCMNSGKCKEICSICYNW